MPIVRPAKLSVLGLCCLALGLAAVLEGCRRKVETYSPVPFREYVLSIPEMEDDGSGGLIAADVDDDGRVEILVTKPGFLGVFTTDGRALWTEATDIQVTRRRGYGLPGLHGPGVQAGDVDGDDRTEVLFLAKDGTLRILDGATGEAEHRIPLSAPAGAERWEHLVVANFRGAGERDLLLQATNVDGYRTGRFLAAYALEDLIGGAADPLWTRNGFIGAAHNGARVADLDGDGRHEVLGGMLLRPDGSVAAKIPVPADSGNHIDSVFVADVRPDLPGLEVVALEERDGDHVFLYNLDGIIWNTHYKNQEPQNAAIGEFDPNRPGLEIWCRSRYNEDQKPFVFDAQGRLIATYEMNHIAPDGWTVRGVEEISTVHWTGDERQFAAAKERHEAGDIAIFDPISGTFLYRMDDAADRLYVADVIGDWREELVTLSGNRLRIYYNDAENPNPDRPRLWADDHYRRSKMTWNYYSP